MKMHKIPTKTEVDLLRNLAQKVDHELRNGILRFWLQKTPDLKNGGYYGRILNNGTPVEEAPRSLILNTRILWSFSRAYNYYHEKTYLEQAERAYAYLINYFWDHEQAGFYWQVDYQGCLLNDRKQIYGQAFGLYALSEYYQASRSAESLEYAARLFNRIEESGRDHQYNGYFEAFSRQWQPVSDVRLSPHDLNEQKSNNTHLHMMEALTAYYKICPQPEAAASLKNSISLMFDRIMEQDSGHFILFFNEKWQKRCETISYGHEIEAAWLLQAAMAALGEQEFTQRHSHLILKIFQNCHQFYLHGENGCQGMFNEKNEKGEVNTDKIWWVQAEACVGFFAAYQETGLSVYLSTAVNLWQFIEDNLIDSVNGEWHWYAPHYSQSETNTTKINEWKSLYHNSRACIELLERIALCLKGECT